MKQVKIMVISKRKIIRNLFIIIAASISLYLLVSLYFFSHFLFNTEINGVNLSLKAHKNLPHLVNAYIKNYDLILVERDGETELIKSQDINMKYNKANSLSTVNRMQNPFMWLNSLFKKSRYYIHDLYEYNHVLLNNKINSLKCLNKEITEPRNVDFKYVDGSYRIVKEIYGNKIIEYLKTNNIDMMKATILSIWEYATLNVIVHDAVLNGEITDISDENKLMEFALNRRPMYPLGDEHIEDVSIEKLDNGTPVAIVKLKDTNWTAISTYIGITYENDKLRIFTLEKSAGFTEEPIYMFCFVSDTSRGFITSIPNSKEEFIKAINMQING